MKKLLLLTLGVVVLVAPASASAAMPKFRSHEIVIGRSIGGVSLGMGAKAAISAWGGNTSCTQVTTTCGWNNNNIDNFASAQLYFSHGKVVGISITTYTNARGVAVCKAPLSSLRTSKRIGLCSTERRLRRAYPKAKVNGGLVTLGHGPRKTVFLFPGRGGRNSRITGIDLGRVFA